ncbi:MAG: TonB-dependent receptor plug domain-containing protein, partial [Sphingomonas sp.]
MAAALLAAAPAYAQTDAAAEPAPPASDPQSGELSPEATIIVTGSRIARSGFNTPVPVTVLGAEDIARRGSANIAEVLNEIPSFRAQSSPTTSAIFISNLGASIADLRGLGGNRTLVLIDGRRVVASTVQGGSFTPANAVDLNLVPTSLLARAEVVTGGASAAYGSDAVAGVTNLIINRDLQGLRGTIQYGQTDRADGQEFFGSLAYGTRFADDRGRFVIGGDFVVNQGLGDCYTRDWCAAGFNTVNNPFVAGSTTTRVIAGQPAIMILPNTITATASRGGLVVSGPLRGLEFGPNGTTLQHNYGTYGSGLFQSGGGPDQRNSFYQFFPLSTPLERVNLLSDFQFEATDKLKLNLQASYGRVSGTLLGTQRRDVSPTGSFQIRNDNAFLPDSVRTRMASAGVASLPFGRIWNDIGPGRGEVARETYRFVAGLTWQLASNVSLDAYYQFGETDYSQRGYNTTINSRVGFAIDSVRDPLSGQIVCRATLPGAAFRAAAAGCVPINPFGDGSPSAAAIGYVTGTVAQDTQIKQH